MNCIKRGSFLSAGKTWAVAPVLLVCMVQSLLLSSSISIAAPEEVTDCDRLAADPDDPSRVIAGVPFSRINANKAPDACYYALQADPDNPRLMYQEGRAFLKYGDRGALEWYQKAADLGYAAAMNSLGDLYETGTYVNQDYSQALHWYRKAVDAGFPSAMHHIGMMYLNGRGVEQDLAEAIRWIRDSAEHGYVVAMQTMGIVYENGLDPIDLNLDEAIRWYRKAADTGDANSAELLAKAKKKKQSETRARAEAEAKAKLETLAKSANAGDKAAMYQLGEMHEHGRGVTKDQDAAMNWYREAANNGESQAVIALDRLEREIALAKSNREKEFERRRAEREERRKSWPADTVGEIEAGKLACLSHKGAYRALMIEGANNPYAHQSEDCFVLPRKVFLSRFEHDTTGISRVVWPGAIAEVFVSMGDIIQ